MKADVHTIDAKKAGSVELADHIFGLEPRVDIIHRVIQWQLNKRQQGTHQAKIARRNQPHDGRSSATRRAAAAPATARARPASSSAAARPLVPAPAAMRRLLNKKVRALGLRHALSSKAKASEIIIIDKAEVKEAKTKSFKAAFAKLGWVNALIIDGATVNEGFANAARNIPNIDVLPVQGINVYDILRRKNLVLTKAAVEALEARFK